MRTTFARLAAGLCLLLGAVAPGQAASPAEEKMVVARKAIAADPARHQAYADLALALARRARETSDPAYYDRAEEAVAKSLAIAPDNLEAQRARIWVALGKHEFAKALELATALNRRMPDDLMTYGFLVDANAELGNYAAAEEAAQWLLDLRPGNIPGLTRAAYLRELFGDVDGALELMRMALARTPPAEVEDRAWILTQMAHLRLMAGGVEAADGLLAQALALFPDYHYALGNQARVRAAQGRHEEALALLERRFRLAPYSENLYAVGEALVRLGRKREARKAFAEFERMARVEMPKADNANRELVFYYADYALKPSEALEVAERELAQRHDLYTLDAHAWALYRNGRYEEARRQIARALEVGIRDAAILYRAAAIALKVNDRRAARMHLQDSLALAPRSEVAASARRLLAGLARPVSHRGEKE